MVLLSYWTDGFADAHVRIPRVTLVKTIWCLQLRSKRVHADFGPHGPVTARNLQDWRLWESRRLEHGLSGNCALWNNFSAGPLSFVHPVFVLG